MTSDAVIVNANRSLSTVVTEMLPNWDARILLGRPRASRVEISSLLQGLLPGIVWNNLVCGLGCLAASLIFISIFKTWGIWAIVMGALTGFWLSSNFTLLYAGHNQKPYVIVFFMATLACVHHAHHWKGGIIWGAFCGLMFMQQPDVAMFFALFAGAYLVFRLWQRLGRPTTLRKGAQWIKVLVPVAVVALLFAAGPLLSGYKQHVQDTAQVQTESPEERWHYITQWSMPPEEMVDFIAPNYTGIRSGEPKGPYWGRMGRSDGWETHRQGFMNYRMESLYLGIIPIAFALFAVFIARWSKHRPDIIFWAIAALVALLLSFGKYFPLYALFYQLPVVNNIRNPNKFLQIFQVALAILTAYGVDGLFRYRQRTVDLSPSAFAKATPDMPSSVLRWFFWVLTVFSGILLLAAVVVTADRTGGVGRFVAQGWPPQAAQVIVANKVYALWHAVFMAGVMLIVFAVFSFKILDKLLKFRNLMAAALVLIVAIDAVKLSRDYVKAMPRSYIDANPLTEFLSENLADGRVALVTQEGIYNIWLTFLLPYNRIPTFNFPAMPRMPIDYKQFLQAGSQNPLRMWQFSAVRFLLAPSELTQQIPETVARKVFTYHLAPAPDDNVRVIPAADGTHAVFELKGALPRYALIADYDSEPGEVAIARLKDPREPLVNGRLIEGGVDLLDYRPGRVELKTNADVPTMLRVAERWDADWKATVNGEPVELLRVDFLCQGVPLPAGKNHVVLAYRPSRFFFNILILGVFLFVLAILGTLKHGKKRSVDYSV